MRAAAVWLPLASFLAIALSLFAFAEIADGIGRKDDLHLLDRQIAEAVIPYVTPASVAFFSAVTWLGSGVVITALGVCVSAVLLRQGELLRLYAWILALVGSGLLNFTLKGWYMRVRPGAMPLLDSWSFPSAHAMNGFVAYGMLVYLLARLLPRKWTPVAVAVAAAVVVVVGASRVMLGYHYFTDVIGGYAAALAWLAVCVTLCEAAERRHHARVNRRRSPQP